MTTQDQQVGPQVVFASRYPREQEALAMSSWMFVWGAGTILLITLITLILLPISNWFKLPVSGGICWLLQRIIRGLRSSLHENYFWAWGAEAEDAAVEQIRAYLDHQWAIFVGLEIPGKPGDIDAVLVGPGGVVAIETKRPEGKLRYMANSWEERQDGAFVAVGKSYKKAAKSQAKSVRDYLSSHGLTYDVTPILFLATDHEPVTTQSGVSVWLPSSCPEMVSNLRQQSKLTTDEASQIINLLRTLTDKPIVSSTIMDNWWCRPVAWVLLTPQIRAHIRERMSQ